MIRYLSLIPLLPFGWFLSSLVALTSLALSSATAQPISIELTKPSHALLITDSSNWNEAWIEVDGSSPKSKKLTIDDIQVTNSTRSAKIISVDSIGSKYASHLALSFVLDNSGSMFHGYESLSRYCDSLLDSLPKGVIAQAVTFDNEPRSDSHLYTRRESVFIAQSSFRDSLPAIRNFWHFFDTIRTRFTPLYDAITAAVGNIESRILAGDTSRTDVILVVTDGEDNASRTDIEMLNDLVSAAHVRLFTINYRTETNPRLTWLARHSSGEYFLAENLTELHDLLKKIGRSLTRQYFVRYQFPSLGPSSGGH